MSELTIYDNVNLVSQQVKNKIFKWVIIGHLMLIMIPLAIYWFNKYSKPKKIAVITVTMVSLPSNNSGAIEPKQMLPVPQPEAKSEPKEAKQPKKVVKKKKIKKVVKKAKSKIKKKTKKVAKKKKPKKKRWKAVSASDIVVSDVTKTFRKKEPVEKFNTQMFSNKFKRNLRRNFKFSRARVSSSVGRMASSNSVSNYYDSVASFLYRQWEQPGNAQLRGKKPAVTVHVVVNKNGVVKSFKISKASGIGVMDSSVRALLKQCKRLPIPPSGAMAFDITLIID